MRKLAKDIVFGKAACGYSGEVGDPTDQQALACVPHQRVIANVHRSSSLARVGLRSTILQKVVQARTNRCPMASASLIQIKFDHDPEQRRSNGAT